MSIKVVVLFQDITKAQALSAPIIGQINLPAAPNINYVGRSHLAGWSESVYWFDNDVANLIAALKTGFNGLPALLVARAALLPQSGSIVGVRLYQGGAGKGQSIAVAYPGGGGPTDYPSVALLCKTGPGNVAVARRFTLRGVPDDQVTNGEFTPTIAYANAVASYFQALNNFVFRGIDPASPVMDIFQVTAVGLVTLKLGPSPFVVGQRVTISKTVDSVGNFVTFTGLVSAIGPLGNQFTIAGWPGVATAGGKAKSTTYGLWAMSLAVSAVSRLVTRRVGRPFEQYRGRRSKKRKIA